LDGIFRAENFRNEIVWKRANAHNDPKRFGKITDTILYYSKSANPVWNTQHTPYREEYYESHFKQDEHGRYFRTVPLDAPRHGNGSPGLLYEWKGKLPASSRTWAIKKEKMEEYEKAGLIRYTRTGTPTLLQYADEMPGVPLQNIWNDIPPVNPQANERLGYPTQKPQVLLERIISASTNPGGLVLDPFCGCGTTIHAAQKSGRQWIGIDVTYLAINLIKRRLKDAFGEDVQFEEHGQPTDFGSAKALAELDKWQFQQWALSLIDARPRTEGDGKGADRGVDGMLYFYEFEETDTKISKPSEKRESIRRRILVQVKGGGVQRNDVATLLGDVNNQKFVGGVLVTLEKPTKPMREEAADAGRYTSNFWHKKDYPKIQILTIEGLLSGKERVDSPPQENPFAKAGLESISGKHTSGKQTELI
jgi:DNA modification methylase